MKQKIAPVGAGAKSNMQLNYSIENEVYQKTLNKLIADELKAFETIGKHLATFIDETDILDERSLDYIHGQGEGMLKVVDGIREVI